MTYTIEVGKPLPGARKLEEEGPLYLFNRKGHCLIMALKEPTYAELKAIRRGPIQIRAVGNDLIMFVLTHFSGMGWSDAPFELEPTLPGDERYIPDEDEALPWVVVALDTTTQNVAAIRKLCPSGKPRHMVHRGLRRIFEREHSPPSRQEVDRYFDAMRRYTSAQLAAMAESTDGYVPMSPTGIVLDPQVLERFAEAVSSFRVGKTR